MMYLFTSFFVGRFLFRPLTSAIACTHTYTSDMYCCVFKMNRIHYHGGSEGTGNGAVAHVRNKN